MNGGRSVCMMYGQTGSGKTYTMNGMQQCVANDLFLEPEGSIDFKIAVSVVEITGRKCWDLLDAHKEVKVLEDNEGNIHLSNANVVPVESCEELFFSIDAANAERKTHATGVNDVSSRSHCVTNIYLLDPATSAAAPEKLKDVYGCITLVDLAGSERKEDQ